MAPSMMFTFFLDPLKTPRHSFHYFGNLQNAVSFIGRSWPKNEPDLHKILKEK